MKSIDEIFSDLHLCVHVFEYIYKASILGHTIKYSCLPSSGNLKSDARMWFYYSPPLINLRKFFPPPGPYLDTPLINLGKLLFQQLQNIESILQLNLSIADTIGSWKRCPL